MSGFKRATVTISEQEYRRLHEADMKRKFQSPRKTNAKRREASPDLSRALQEMEDRQRDLEQALSSVQQEAGRLDDEAIQGLLAQNARTYARLNSIVEETAAHTDESFAHLSRLVSERMQEERQEYQRSLQGLVQRLDMYQQEGQAREAFARQWLNRSAVLADFIQKEFDHERFLPGRLATVLIHLDFARTNLENGLLETSIQNSQQAFLQLSDLRLELEQKTLEWRTEFDRAQHALRELLAELELNAQVNGVDLEGEELPEMLDVAYWTDGKYRHLLENCRHLLEILVQDQRQISTEELRQTHTELLPVTRANLESLIFEARLRALNSQIRVNIADTALQALEVHGFRLDGAAYDGEDMRSPFTARLSNQEGVEVTIQVLPGERANQELASELIVITRHPDLKTEETARGQWREICRSLSEYALDVSPPEVRSAESPVPSKVTTAQAPDRSHTLSGSRR